MHQHVAFFDATFPGYRLEAEDMIANDDKIAVCFTMHGTHKGEMMGVPPTDKTVSMEGIIIYKLADGKIIEHWMQTDTTSPMQQLRAMPQAA